jgi:hypothetical protein
MAFFRCVFVDEFGHTVFPADITADNLETATAVDSDDAARAS